MSDTDTASIPMQSVIQFVGSHRVLLVVLFMVINNGVRGKVRVTPRKHFFTLILMNYFAFR